jgi:CheY-like chemotaxis protein
MTMQRRGSNDAWMHGSHYHQERSAPARGGPARRVIPLTVLIVDDEADMRLYLRSCLRGLESRLGCVLEAADGVEAMNLARNVAVHLVITDVGLPRLSGLDLCRQIKRDPELCHIAVLLITGDDRGGALRDSADGLLTKPFNTQQLLAALEVLPVRLPRAPPS